ncbi:MAG: hypothetical protein ISR99_01505 [Parcubacteria group bacterium]|nr:hypothetical protein [Parcubacteria group bacterium]
MKFYRSFCATVLEVVRALATRSKNEEVELVRVLTLMLMASAVLGVITAMLPIRPDILFSVGILAAFLVYVCWSVFWIVKHRRRNGCQ